MPHTPRRPKGVSTLIIVALVVIALLVGLVTWVIISTQGERDQLNNAAQGEIEGVQVFEEYLDVRSDHVGSDVTYEQTPPVGGDHDPAWANCNYYENPIRDENAVHSLEHGAVWITHSPDLDQESISELQALAEENRYLMVSPYPGMDSPLVLSAWGHQLKLDSVDDERLQVFLVKYLQGEQTPEPGAACSNGIDFS